MLVLQSRPVHEVHEVPVDVIVYLGSQREKTFRCPCGCNVFRHPVNPVSGKLIKDRYVCNSCGGTFIGE